MARAEVHIPRGAKHVPAALLVAVLIELTIRRVPIRRLAALLQVPLELSAAPSEAGPATALGPRQWARLEAVLAVYRGWPWARDRPCLRMALAGGWMLRAHDPRLRLGVAEVRGRVQAHAWIVVAGLPLDPTAPRWQTLQTLPDGLQ